MAHLPGRLCTLRREKMADGEIVVPDYDDSAQDAGALSLDDLASMQAKPAGGLADKIPLSRTHALGLYVVSLRLLPFAFAARRRPTRAVLQAWP